MTDPAVERAERRNGKTKDREKTNEQRPSRAPRTEEVSEDQTILLLQPCIKRRTETEMTKDIQAPSRTILWLMKRKLRQMSLSPKFTL
jgi:hypothetical protein